MTRVQYNIGEDVDVRTRDGRTYYGIVVRETRFFCYVKHFTTDYHNYEEEPTTTTKISRVPKFRVFKRVYGADF